MGWTLIAIGAVSLHGAQARVHSPWEGKSPPAEHRQSYRCNPVSPPPQVISFEGYYSDSRHSVTDPEAKRAYENASAPTEEFLRAVVNASDAYRIEGRNGAAACALRRLASAADAKSFAQPRLAPDGSRQAFYVQTWMTAGLALAYLKVEDVASAAQRKLIGRWLGALGGHVRAFQDRMSELGSGNSRNNHHAWGGLAAAAAGIAADRRDLLAWGVQAGRDELAQVEPTGILPLEMARGRMALHYHLFTAAPLVILAELARANGVDLYGERNEALSRLVLLTLAGTEDPSLFAAKSGSLQEIPGPNDGLICSLLPPFERRLSKPRSSGVTGRNCAGGYAMLGGTPPP